MFVVMVSVAPPKIVIIVQKIVGVNQESIVVIMAFVEAMYVETKFVLLKKIEHKIVVKTVVAC